MSETPQSTDDQDESNDGIDHTDPADRTGLDPAEQRTAVRQRYADVATEGGSCCGDGDDSGSTVDEETACCESGGSDESTSSIDSERLGYTQSQLEAVESGADLGLGCGNPTAIADLEAGETVLDLGAGGGFDCFLAAREVGDSGRVIGVDMTPEMVEKARENARKNDAENVEFRLGEIEHLPVADETVDVILSNCVINLSPDKPRVFEEAYRVLNPGGRLAVSDVVRSGELPDDLAADPASVASCIGDAAPVDEIEAALREAGFVDVAVEPKEGSREFIDEWDPERDLGDYVVSASIRGRKPER
ncbi:arsenite S-adenosylmethyltransferase [Halalkaliarchaeum desulfuricum]|uniref:Arsenite methyltransferase n=1 Tax=Halalkaliarchaeum desulfuricum TaxID=2055893 RepID=A0A343TKA5_9EURY|nr:arsenite methyltransferase [Halalkaliarchaeum desulfuricum]AUX09527.1 arsenite S-adenosylmethyltransferase [Halalkaliarchaeum desulfuricum]